MDKKLLLLFLRSRRSADTGLSLLEVLVATMVVFFTIMGALNGVLYAAIFQIKAERQAQASFWIQQDLEQVKAIAATLPTNNAQCTPTFTTSYAGNLQTTLASNTAITATSPTAVSVTGPPAGRTQTQIVRTSEPSTTFTTNTTRAILGREYRLARVTEGYDSSPQVLRLTYRVGLPTDSTSDTDRIQDDTTNNTSTLATLYTEIIPAAALSCP